MGKRLQFIAGIFKKAGTLNDKRLGYIDIAKMIAIFAVMFEHSQYYVPGVQQDKAFLIFRIWVFGFFFQTFFFSAGIVDKQVGKDSWKTFLSKLVSGIFVPYIAWCFIWGTHFDASFLKGIFWGTQTSIAGAGTDGLLWFFPVLIVARILYKACCTIMIRVLHKRSVFFLLASAIVLGAVGWSLADGGENRIWFGGDIAMVAAALMLVGQVLVGVVECLREGKWTVKLAALVICLIISVVSCYTNMPYYIDEAGIFGYKEVVIMAQGYFGWNGMLFMISSVSTCMVILIVAMYLEKILPSMARWGQYSMGFMLMHGKLFPLAVTILTGLIGINTQISPFLFALISTFIVTVLCMPIIVAVNKFLPQLLGKAKT